MFAAGHDLTAVGGVAAMLDELVAAAGPGRVGLVHANDSLLGCGSTRDRHEALGAGKRAGRDRPGDPHRPHAAPGEASVGLTVT